MTDIPLNTLIQWTEKDRERGECPVPVRETVTLYGGEAQRHGGTWAFDYCTARSTHRITFDLEDGKPDCEKCPTCGTAKSVDMEEL